jgi:hypothetical protein
MWRPSSDARIIEAYRRLVKRKKALPVTQNHILNDDGTRASSEEAQLQPDNSTITKFDLAQAREVSDRMNVDDIREGRAY